MNFWEISPDHHARPALIDAESGTTLTYRQLDEAVAALASSVLKRDKQLIFLFCHNRPQDVIAYLAALRAGHAVLLLESKMEAVLRDNLIATYRPDLLIDADPAMAGWSGYTRRQVEQGIGIFAADQPSGEERPFAELGVLLSTSGTTGSPKLVRLAYRNVQANAAAIAEYLSITAGEVAITSLPMSYSYGLSVINSHLLRGAALVCTKETMAQRKFWELFRAHSCTTFAGVPYHYQILLRIGFKSLVLPTLRTMTQAGGRLSEECKKAFVHYAEQHQVRFVVMYGQTEATARISYVPPAMLSAKLSSIGIPIPGGKLSLRHDGREISGVHTDGELVYEGPNVMLGYAESRADLAKGDEQHGVLSTGDVAYRDEDGYYHITGRMKRFLKVFGLRLNLDDIEKFIENQFPCMTACTGNDDLLVVLVDQAHGPLAEPVKQSIVQNFKIHGSVVRVKVVPEIPVTPSGKKDYAKIKALGLS